MGIDVSSGAQAVFLSRHHWNIPTKKWDSTAKRHIKRNGVRQECARSLTDEEELKGLEEARQAALEMAQEEDEKAEESPEAPQEVGLSASDQLGVWGSLVSLRAPVMGMISVGFADQ